jgi:dTDP-4-dehydrorhamnose 3,5-epimerase-like enzyme
MFFCDFQNPPLFLAKGIGGITYSHDSWVITPSRKFCLRYEDIMDRLTVEKLPNTKEILGAKRWEEERGEFVQVTYDEAMHHLAAFEIRKGFSRGNHYHEKKEEIFYVFQGKIKASFIDMDTLQKEEKILEKGDRIRVKPRCGHLFYGLEDTVVIEYSPQVYDKKDSYKIDLG